MDTEYDKLMQMMKAVEDGKVAEVKKWLAAGVSPNERHYFMRELEGNGEVMDALRTAMLEDMAEEAGKDITDYWVTPLLSAIMTKQKVGMVKLLVEAGGDVNLADDEGLTPLMHSDCSAVTELLLQRGADVHARDCGGRTALLYARTAGQVRLLLAAGADPNAVDKTGNTALMCVPDAEIAGLLLAAGVDVNHRNATGVTALLLAESPDVAKALLAAGADETACDAEGNNALHVAAILQNKEQVRFWARRGMPLDAVNEEGLTALDLAEEAGNEGIAKILRAAARSK